MPENVLNRSFLSDLLANFQANLKAWSTLIAMAISFAVRFGWIAPNSIDETTVANYIVMFLPLIAYLVPNRKQLTTGETVNVNNIAAVVDTKVEKAVEKAEGK